MYWLRSQCLQPWQTTLVVVCSIAKNRRILHVQWILVHQWTPSSKVQRNGTLQQSGLWASSPTPDCVEKLTTWLLQCDQIYAFRF
jgi:hypothetical protein